MKTNIRETPQLVGQAVTLAGWVHSRRNMGKIVFIDLRDRTGIIQVVLAGDLQAGSESVTLLRPEFVVRIQGVVARRKGGENANLATGQVEIQATGLEILNEAKTPPFEITNEERQANEDLRMRYRYLDLRHARMAKNLTMRHQVIRFIREYLSNQDFLEIETPYLTKGTPEGAREYIVPSRQFPGQFYTLPQSPQQFKQLLMVGGLERYFQVARCFRDEDTRGDRQPEFTQLDVEMSFVDEADIMSLIEDMFMSMMSVVLPDYTLTATPFPRIPYEVAMRDYGSDRPDIRRDKSNPKELGFCFVVDFPMFEHSATEDRLVPTHHLFTSPKDVDLPLLETDPQSAKAKQYDLVLNGFEIAGGSIRIHRADV
ncbi:MAG: aspartate--tRNA ligase, partial [Candidatus Kerfeldbacteria bacterium]|nr:aspartate--tRNA ligase [Candidatus Kerfeldbacteria bacterium]